MKSCPVYIDGKECGTLTCRTEGLMTVFSAVCRTSRSGIIRLSVFGGEKTAFLGTLCPQHGELVLERRFTRTELAKLPENIEYAADAPLREEKSCGGDTLWRRGFMGCLVSDGLIAIPAEARAFKNRALNLRQIEGGTYLIFKI